MTLLESPRKLRTCLVPYLVALNETELSQIKLHTNHTNRSYFQQRSKWEKNARHARGSACIRSNSTQYTPLLQTANGSGALQLRSALIGSKPDCLDQMQIEPGLSRTGQKTRTDRSLANARGSIHGINVDRSVLGFGEIEFEQP